MNDNEADVYCDNRARENIYKRGKKLCLMGHVEIWIHYLEGRKWDPWRYVTEPSKIKAKACNTLWHKAHIRAEEKKR